MRKSILIITTLILTGHIVFAQNIMSIPNYSGNSGDTLTIAAEIANVQQFVGFQFDFPIPNVTNYIPNSAILNPARSNGQTLVASIIGTNILRIICYSFTQTPFLGNSGPVMTFKLRLGNIPGTYPLQLINPIIANSQSQNILTGYQNGSLAILAPEISVNPTSLDFGEVALTQYQDRSFTIYNNGTLNLNIGRLSTNHPYFQILGDTSFILLPNASQSVTVRFTAISKGTFNQLTIIESNDPDEPSTQIPMTVYAYAVNELDVNDTFGRSGFITTLTLDIANMEPFVGFQFDLILPSVMSYVPNSAVLTNRAVNHSVFASITSANVLTVVAYSAMNTNFLGNSGDVVELTFNLNGQGGFYAINLQNPIIADSTGANIISDYYGGQLEIAAPDIWINPASISFGQISIFDTNCVEIQIGNNGSDTLFFNNFIFSNAAFFADFSELEFLTINSNTTVPISFHSGSEGNFSGQLSVYTNDPNENPYQIALSGATFIPNYMSLSDIEVFYSDTAEGSLNVTNFEPCVALQCDIQFPLGINYLSGTAQLTSRASNHLLAANMISANTLRLLVYSLIQAPFAGDSGTVVTFDIIANGNIGNYTYSISNAILSNAQLQNILAATVNGVITINPNYPGSFYCAYPVNGTVVHNDTVNIGWYSSTLTNPEDEIEYEINWSLSPAFYPFSLDTSLDTFYTINGVSNYLDELPDDTTIYWRVKAINSYSLSVWAENDSSGWCFHIDVPQTPEGFNLISPAYGDTCWILNTTLIWEETIDPDPYDLPYYELWLDTLPDLSGSWLEADSISDTTIILMDLLHNRDYYWTMRATDSNTGGKWANDTLMFHADNFMFSQTFFAPGWHQISIPRDPEDNSVNGIFGDNFTNAYFVYTFNQTSGYSFEDTLEVGKGYWLANLDSAMADIEGEVITDTVYVDLSQGWSLIGATGLTECPLNTLKFFNGYIILDFIQAVNSFWISPALFGYNNNTRSYFISNQLTPWEGYWLYALEEGLQAVYCPQFDNLGGGGRFMEFSEEVENWTVTIELQQGTIFNDASCLGMDSQATDGYDIWFDFPAPPIPPSGDYVRAIFQHPEWNAPVGDDFSTDIRALFITDEKYIWDFILQASDTGLVNIAFDSLNERLPSGYTLIAAYEAHRVNLREQNSFNLYYSAPIEIGLELIEEGTVEGAAESYVLPPTEFTIASISPNPFNSSISIRIGLPETAKLRMEAFNILGQRVALLQNGMVSAGWHNFDFNASSFSSGIYFIKIEIPGKMREIKKVLFIP